ncbi:putative SnoaL-like domain-containing protein [Seiridium cardinale]
MSHYKAQYPAGVVVDPEIVRFIEQFYQISDTPGAHEDYVDQFTSDATFKLASKTGKGHDEITTLRHGMWTAVSQRKHTIHKVFPYGGSQELMLYGDVEYELRAGGKATVEWGGRAELEKSTKDGKYRMKFYQVYLDTAAANSSK